MLLRPVWFCAKRIKWDLRLTADFSFFEDSSSSTVNPAPGSSFFFFFVCLLSSLIRLSISILPLPCWATFNFWLRTQLPYHGNRFVDGFREQQMRLVASYHGIFEKAETYYNIVGYYNITSMYFIIYFCCSAVALTIGHQLLLLSAERELRIFWQLIVCSKQITCLSMMMLNYASGWTV